MSKSPKIRTVTYKSERQASEYGVRTLAKKLTDVVTLGEMGRVAKHLKKRK